MRILRKISSVHNTYINIQSIYFVNQMKLDLKEFRKKIQWECFLKIGFLNKLSCEIKMNENNVINDSENMKPMHLDKMSKFQK